MAIVIAFGSAVSAHRRDEYLHAARIAIEPDRVHVELDLTPGSAVANGFIHSIDGDGDGVVSSEEQQAYARRVLSSIDLRVDGKPLQMKLVASRFPDVDAVRTGEGTITLDLDVVVPLFPAGRHHLYFRNTNDPDSAEYLANALVPEDDRISITRQVRDAIQSELAIEFVVRRSQALSARESVFFTMASAAVLLLPLARRARMRRG